VAEGGGDMSAPIASLFTDALEFIFVARESVTGGVQVGGIGEISSLTANHMVLSAAAIAIACVIALPLGLWLGHVGKGEFLAISVSNIGRAVPTLALIAFFIAFVGIGFFNVLLALILLAIPPLLTNTYVGVRGVSPDAVDAARDSAKRTSSPSSVLLTRVSGPASTTAGASSSATSAISTMRRGPGWRSTAMRSQLTPPTTGRAPCSRESGSDSARVAATSPPPPTPIRSGRRAAASRASASSTGPL
jgi:hypothetical protein